MDLNINLLELGKIKNLEILTLLNCSINDDCVELFNKMKKLNTLHFGRCYFVSKRTIDNPDLNDLMVSDCMEFDISNYYAPSILQIINCMDVDISQKSNLEKVEKIKIQNGNVTGSKNLLTIPNLNSVSLVGSKLDDDSIIKGLKNRGIDISIKDEEYPIR